MHVHALLNLGSIKSLKSIAYTVVIRSQPARRSREARRRLLPTPGPRLLIPALEELVNFLVGYSHGAPRLGKIAAHAVDVANDKLDRHILTCRCL